MNISFDINSDGISPMSCCDPAIAIPPSFTTIPLLTDLTFRTMFSLTSSSLPHQAYLTSHLHHLCPREKTLYRCSHASGTHIIPHITRSFSAQNPLCSSVTLARSSLLSFSVVSPIVLLPFPRSSYDDNEVYRVTHDDNEMVYIDNEMVYGVIQSTIRS